MLSRSEARCRGRCMSYLIGLYVMCNISASNSSKKKNISACCFWIVVYTIFSYPYRGGILCGYMWWDKFIYWRMPHWRCLCFLFERHIKNLLNICVCDVCVFFYLWEYGGLIKFNTSLINMVAWMCKKARKEVLIYDMHAVLMFLPDRCYV